MSLDVLHERMAWPHATTVIRPQGAGPKILLELARQKIERTLQALVASNVTVRVGLLTKNPFASTTEAPIAVVCEFSRPVSAKVCSTAHRLAWNFARTPLLVTIEPHQARTWSCCEPPIDEDRALFGVSGEIEQARLDLTVPLSPSEQAAHALYWVRLTTGEFYSRFPDRFKRDGTVERVLLEELTRVRRRLKRQDLSDDIIHDLLARVVFAQFLCDRKDADGRAAINPSLLSKLRAEGNLTQEHSMLATILGDYDDAYRFFRWLNDKFNGDLFPGKGGTEANREAEWQAEMAIVRPHHLQTLADFIEGRLQSRQRLLWRVYCFDVIPLEFISSIYEEFVRQSGAHYTPSFLVDFMLDEVLPWESEEWDLKILDPACGSGIFLVKVFQRLIHRWKNAHPGEKPTPELLRRILERNLFGVDIDPHAVRVASFSLYLTMCDELDPKSYLKNTKFPRLRERTLIHADFFREELHPHKDENDVRAFDLVIGNAPWGQNTATDLAYQWANHPERRWPIANNAIGTLFLAKAASLTKQSGRVSMIQPASSLLFNRSGPANRFRERLFSEFKIEEVVNLSTLRFELFENATSPPCIVTMRPIKPDGEPLLYISPKQAKPAGGTDVAESSYTVVIEPHDISRVWPDEAVSDSFVWTALAWGGRRDLHLLNRLSEHTTFEELRKRRAIHSREGMIRGDRGQRQDQICGRHILEVDDFPDGVFLYLDASALPINEDPWTHSRDSTSYEAFQFPQLVIKQGWTVSTERFRAVIVTNPAQEGVICSQSYISVHCPIGESKILESAALSYNSSIAVYFLLLSSGRLASYRPEPLVEEMRSVPLANVTHGVLDGLSSVEEVDDRVKELFGLRDAEWVLVEDLCKYTLPDFKGDETSPGRQPTNRYGRKECFPDEEPHLTAYCEYFLRVLRAGFGQDKAISATIFQDAHDTNLPVRLVAIHLEKSGDNDIIVQRIDSFELCTTLLELNEKFLHTGDTRRGGVFFQRVALVYVNIQIDMREVPTIYIVKPDRIRYWTRSAALRDADEVAADVQVWNEVNSAATGRHKSK